MMNCPCCAGSAAYNGEFVAVAGLLGVGEEFLHVAEFVREISTGAAEGAGWRRHVTG